MTTNPYLRPQTNGSAPLVSKPLAQAMAIDPELCGISSADDSSPDIHRNSPFTRPSSNSSEKSENSVYFSGNESLKTASKEGESAKTTPRTSARLKVKESLRAHDKTSLDTIVVDVNAQKLQTPTQHKLSSSISTPTPRNNTPDLSSLTAELALTQKKLREKEAELAIQAGYLQEYLSRVASRDKALEEAQARIRELESQPSPKNGGGDKEIKTESGQIGGAVHKVDQLLFSCRVNGALVESDEYVLRIMEPAEARGKLERAVEMTRQGVEGECSPLLKRDAEGVAKEVEREILDKFVWKWEDGAMEMDTGNRSAYGGRWEYREGTLEGRLLEAVRGRRKLEIEAREMEKQNPLS